jgi:Flp pilus assembly protein TadD
MDYTDVDQRLAAIERELEKGLDNSEAWAAKADILCSLNIHCCNKSLTINPHNEFTWATKCHALDKLGRHDEAETAFAKAEACRLNPVPLSVCNL